MVLIEVQLFEDECSGDALFVKLGWDLVIDHHFRIQTNPIMSSQQYPGIRKQLSVEKCFLLCEKLEKLNDVACKNVHALLRLSSFLKDLFIPIQINTK